MDDRHAGVAGEMPPYVVGCLETDARLADDGHHHVKTIETRDPDGGQTRWTLIQVITAIRDGAAFSVNDGDDAVARLDPTVCPRCAMATLTIEPPEAASLVPTCDSA